jgi:hypothetical protein
MDHQAIKLRQSCGMNAINLMLNGLNGCLKILYTVSPGFLKFRWERLSDFIIEKSNYYHFAPLQPCCMIDS